MDQQESIKSGAPVELSYQDLSRHVLFSGANGSGIRVVVNSVLCQHIKNGLGMLVVSKRDSDFGPLGDCAEDVGRKDDVIHFNISSPLMSGFSMDVVVDAMKSSKLLFLTIDQQGMRESEVDFLYVHILKEVRDAISERQASDEEKDVFFFMFSGVDGHTPPFFTRAFEQARSARCVLMFNVAGSSDISSDDDVTEMVLGNTFIKVVSRQPKGVDAAIISRYLQVVPSPRWLWRAIGSKKTNPVSRDFLKKLDMGCALVSSGSSVIGEIIIRNEVTRD